MIIIGGWLCLSLVLHLLLLLLPEQGQDLQGQGSNLIEVGLVAAPAPSPVAQTEKKQPLAPAQPAPTPQPKAAAPALTSKPRKTPAIPSAPKASPRPQPPPPIASPQQALEPDPVQALDETPGPAADLQVEPKAAPPAQKNALKHLPEKPSSRPASIAPAQPGNAAATPGLTLAVPRYDFSPQPRYPRLALKRGWQGEALLRVQVGIDGDSHGVELERSSGHRILDEAAMEAVRQWRFHPGRRGLLPVETEVLVPIRFTLRSS